MSMPKVVSRQEWQQARDALLVQEKEATQALDALAARRRRLPMVRFGSDHEFRTPDGAPDNVVSMQALFDGRRQLIVYQFMDNGPDDYCPGCSSFVDNVGRLEHLHARDTSFVVVSNMPLEQLQAYAKRMEWTFPFVSSHGTSFAEDCGAGTGFGISVFLRDDNDVYQTYFATSRAGDRVRFDFNMLDLTPYGRQEEWEDSPEGWPQTPPYQWWRLHDEY
ncbi:MAG: hypothetical protein JWR37_4010 [Mycobacterium sp.]|nr:hypothetical protein [Mycobacterium sp.]